MCVPALVAVLIISSTFLVICIMPTIDSTPPITHTVNSDGSADFSTIQEAVDAASSGDTVFVKSGTYWENVVIGKTLNLTGEDRDTTIINCSTTGIRVENVDFVNVTGFTVENGSSGGSGIAFIHSNSSIVYNCRVEKNGNGITISNCNNTIVRDNIASNSCSIYHGIYLSSSTNVTIENNICANNQFGNGIRLQESPYNFITNNSISNNDDGIQLMFWSDNVILHNNKIDSNTNYGIWIDDSENSISISNVLNNNSKGIYYSWNSKNNKLINTTILNSSIFDVGVRWDSHVKALNTTFNKDKTYFDTTDSTINVQWYLHINVTDYLGDCVPNAIVKIEDNLNGSDNITLSTDGEGYIKWIYMTEYIEQDNTGDTIGEKTYFTPHRIIAWNDTLVGYAYPEPLINKSKTINIVLYNGTLVNMDNNNWNMISIPRIQSDTNLNVVLQSIEGRYKSVQWYDASDITDHWKHYCTSKLSYMNDLKSISHTMGLWIDIIDPQGTTLVIYGDQLTSNQTIPLKPGWNFVGFPSSSNKLVNDSLNGIFYGSDVDAIWTYNSTTQKWTELGLSDYFEVGRGYWIHSRVEENWEIPL